MDNKYIDICEGLGWSVTDTGDGEIELGKYSPAGEDFSFGVEAENFVENVKAYAASFNQDEHVEMWVMARINGTSGVPSCRELVEDAKAIDDMLRELAQALFSAELEAVGK